jgi:hypothetical protein
VFLYIIPLAGLLMSALGIVLLFILGDGSGTVPAKATTAEVAEIGDS